MKSPVIGGAVIAMITRTARGHTGLRIVAEKWDVACYALVISARACGCSGRSLRHRRMVLDLRRRIVLDSRLRDLRRGSRATAHPAACGCKPG